MADKRIVNGQKVSVAEIVDAAMAIVDSGTLNTESARQSLRRLGHQNPDEILVIRYARETAILAALQSATGANFSGQIGKISFVSRERAIVDVQSYLNRRNQGQRSRWTASH